MEVVGVNMFAEGIAGMATSLYGKRRTRWREIARQLRLLNNTQPSASRHVTEAAFLDVRTCLLVI